MNVDDRRQAALDSLEGLSTGDAFGERFFVPDTRARAAMEERCLPDPPWHWTDDTNMALSVVEVLLRDGSVDQDALARSFARRYDPRRGYGAAMHALLRRIAGGWAWAEVARGQFGGEGSYGNGAAMRVAPLGAWFSDDLGAAAGQAERSAVVTHAHPEGVAGAVAVAVAAALSRRSRGAPPPDPAAFLEEVRAWVPAGAVADGLGAAAGLGARTSVARAVSVLGNGSEVSAQDTVPFALWCASRGLDDFEAAAWETVSGLGDRDTTCAIVGGVVGARVGTPGIPPLWRERREPLPPVV
ncbi:MAG: ADP-ribosylglycohydrolase family protein [Actinomycetota bacterium]|nr:ADP-ribosylglycohydrolase family protein [Actinomycetota bacterium]